MISVWWLFLIVPAVSLVTIIFLFGAMLFSAPKKLNAKTPDKIQ